MHAIECMPLDFAGVFLLVDVVLFENDKG